MSARALETCWTVQRWTFPRSKPGFLAIKARPSSETLECQRLLSVIIATARRDHGIAQTSNAAYRTP